MSDNKLRFSQQPPESAREAFDQWHANCDVDSESDTPWHRFLKNHLVEERDIAKKRILEIGCGRGGFACWLATRESKPGYFVAADFSEVAVSKAQAFAAESKVQGVSWQVQDIQRLEFPAESFDTVISCETIEHVPNPRLALRELSRVLKPGGRLFLTCPSYLGLAGLYRIYLRACGRKFTEVGQPINQFLLLPLTRYWVTCTGLCVELTDGVGHTLPFPGRPGIKLPIDHPKLLLKWFAQQTMLIAKK